MATAGKPAPSNFNLWFREADHPVWFHSFSESQRQQLVKDDLQAGRIVPLILTAIICVGLALAVISVLACR